MKSDSKGPGRPKKEGDLKEPISGKVDLWVKQALDEMLEKRQLSSYLENLIVQDLKKKGYKEPDEMD